jgi:hypothetical protein
LLGDWLGPIDGLDAMEKRKISYLYRESNPYFLLVHTFTDQK